MSCRRATESEQALMKKLFVEDIFCFVFRKAKLILRRKKYQESLLKKTEGQLDNLDQMVSSIEFATLEVQVVNGLEQGNEALKELKRELDVDRVERVMDDAAELQAWTDVRRFLPRWRPTDFSPDVALI